MPRTTRSSMGKVPVAASEIPDTEAESSPPPIKTSRSTRARASLPSNQISSSLKAPRNRTVAVVVPRAASVAPSTRSASGASIASGDSGIELATPGTSVTVTPFGLNKSTNRKTAATNLSKVNQRLSTGSARRRTRSAQEQQDDQEAADAELAQKLQADEYEDAGPSTAKSSAKTPTRKYIPFDDTDDDDDAFVKTSTRRSTNTKQKLPVDSETEEEVPARPRTSFKKKLPAESKPEVEDSDDESFTMTNEDVSVSAFDDDSQDDFVPFKAESASRKRQKLPSGKSKALIGKTSYASLNPGSAPPSLGTATSDGLSTAASTDADTAPTPTLKRRRRTHGSKPHGMTRDFWEREKLLRSHPKIKTLWTDLENTTPIIEGVAGEQPEGINRTLKSFQLQGVNWMRRMETEGRWKGGLLGDEMGMGKTIQAVSLIMSDYPAGKPSLVVVPPVALMQWSAEIKSYTDGKLNILVYHNQDTKVKKLTKKELQAYDVIMISYNSLEAMMRKEVDGLKRDGGLVKENSKIHSIDYHRLILDEAHSIKTRTTKVARACFALKSDYKWCLSGTPVQNRIGEFFSLLRFLKVDPFCSYFCKECDCETVHWDRNESGECNGCGHRGFDHVSLFNQELLNPITSGSTSEREDAMRKLRLITDRIMLRRIKRDYTASMELPPKHVIVHNEFFGPQERDFNKSIMTNTTRTFDTYVSRGVMLNNYANIFGLIMQMRQAANHPDLILRKHSAGGQNVLVCCICDEPAEEPIRSQCHHEFCRGCVKDYVRSSAGSAECPQCHIALKIDLDQPDVEQDEDAVKKSSIINRIKMEEWHSSTKIEMLVYDLYKLRSRKRTVKSIVFSQFTSMLQLIDWRLRRAGFNTVMLDGSMTPAQRQKSIEHFMNNVDCEVFLVSLKAGGVALNLTEASNVFIVDPWWNPAAEWQSADRVHRIGQRRPCTITRLVIEDSVESRMVQLQEKKANLINSTINRDDVALGKLTPEDMQFLFRGN